MTNESSRKERIRDTMSMYSVVIVGAGPAGLSAAQELAQNDVRAIVFEKHALVGGIARTEEYKGYRFDIGGHRFYTKVAEVQQFWQTLLGDDFRKVARQSRIYYRGRYYRYPLDLLNTLTNLGVVESIRILCSYAKTRLRPLSHEDTFEEWVINRFGERLYRTFFKTYTEKVWGISCTQIRADWAAQRIRGLSLTVAVLDALVKKRDVKTLIDAFYYPALGPGQMWEQCQQAIMRKGSAVHINTEVERLRHDQRKLTSVLVRQGDEVQEIPAPQVISSIPLPELLAKLDPTPPEPVLTAARSLRFRAFILVGLIVNQAHVFPDNWIYIHSPEVRVGRIQNFKNWSRDLVADQQKTSLGMEYFCNEDDPLWTSADADLLALAKSDLDQLGLAYAADVEDGIVIRQAKAYPVYDETYRRHLAVIQDYLSTFENLQTIGRNGMHRYNNQDHSMLTGMLAARNILGETHDLWNVNTDRSYYEEFTTAELKGQSAHASAQDRDHRLRTYRRKGASQSPDTVTEA